MTEQDMRPVTAARMKWNDMRRVGPLLIMALIAVVVTFGSASNVDAAEGAYAPSPADCYSISVGAAEDCCGPRIKADVLSVANLVGDSCGESPKVIERCPPYAYFDGSECCVSPGAVTGVILKDCVPKEDPVPADDAAEGEPETTPPPPAPVRKPPPSPDAIMGPIWLGAIQVDVLAPGLVELEFPDLLDAFIGSNIVKVYDADGVLVYEDGLPANGKMLVFSSNAPMTVKTTLTTLARYTEIVAPVGSTS